MNAESGNGVLRRVHHVGEPLRIVFTFLHGQVDTQFRVAAQKLQAHFLAHAIAIPVELELIAHGLAVPAQHDIAGLKSGLSRGFVRLHDLPPRHPSPARDATRWPMRG